ncbi:protein binding protein, putative [Ricinus communis]|uniref:Protein binding protein, putative n=1 Tax=Ricinus communis TaxID=3988 RepID=B9T3Z5_RICCO|nr:protein binding protein, putative [Ricinus communis]|eukprot:XP_002532964.1 protease Do-like 7 [Ricinus communis]
MEDDYSQKLESEMESAALQSSEGEQEDVMSFREKVDTAGDWRETINKVVPAVVDIRITTCRAFDTELPASGYATGFVVDKKRGIILSNRHVVHPGPIVAQAIFTNREEINVYPIYRDPVHDFGFFRYDPAEIQFLDYQEIPLAPEAACVGLEIRVVGNDSREKVSILAGTLARLDREAPKYKKDGYNDFNTFYIQAASGTKGGSSGSPVIDRQGRAVALNAGSKLSTSSAYFLPLERVVRAMRLIQQGRDSNISNWGTIPIPRGTLQVTFHYEGFEKARRLGLQSETEQMVRRASPPGGTGMLVVHSVVPGGPAHMQLEPGDVLICMNGEYLLQGLLRSLMFMCKVDIMKILTHLFQVQDLHSITPDHFLEVSGAVIHPLSYQQARNFCFPCGLVYVSEPGYMLSRAGVPRHAIIKKFTDVEISRLEDLISVLSKLSRGARVPLEYITYKDRHRRKSALVTVDRHEWYDAPKIYTRDDSSGIWLARPAIQPESLLLSSCISNLEQGSKRETTALISESTVSKVMPRTNDLELTQAVASLEVSYDHAPKEVCSRSDSDVERNNTQVIKDLSRNENVVADSSSHEIGEKKLEDPMITECYNENSTEAVNNASFPERVIEPALVMVEVHMPPSCLLDGVHSRHNLGTGVIVYHSQGMGLVAVDRNTVTLSACDVVLSFAAFPIELPGEVVFLHPVYNYALVAYNPSALGTIGASMVRAAELLPEPTLCRGDPVYLVGLRSLQAISRKSTVTNSCLSLHVSSADPPCYRATNMEVIELDSDFGNTFTGVLSNEHGKVQALWASFSTKVKPVGNVPPQFVKGIPIYMISQILEKIITSGNESSLLINGVKRSMPLVSILEVELIPRSLSKARSFGLSEEWIHTLVKKDPTRRQVLRVKGCLAGSKAETLLKQGDMVLAVNKEPVTCFRDIENACIASEKSGDNDGKLNMTIFRQGCEVDVLVGIDIRDGNSTTRMINWCGCIVQCPHPGVRALGFLPGEGHGVYVVKSYRGSPADRYGLTSLRWIVEINGKPTTDLDAFAKVTKDLECEEFVRIKTINLKGKPQVLTLKQDLHYWPTWELRFDPETTMWRRQTIKALQ